MRVKLKKVDLEYLFQMLKNKYKTWVIVSQKLQVSPRQLLEWRNNSYTIPKIQYDRVLNILNLNDSVFEIKILEDYWNTKKAGNIGAIRRMQLYGNFGTVKGRIKGGVNSVKKNSTLENNFQRLIKINYPKNSENLAELLGVYFGDGHLSNYQASICTSSITDLQHAKRIKVELEATFGLPVKEILRSRDNTINIIISSKNVVNFLYKKGMPKGNKIMSGLSVPNWIKGNKIYSKAFVRGLFDTDGSVYLERHTSVSGKVYLYIGIAITSYSANFLLDLVKVMNNLGYQPSCKPSQKSIFLRKQDQVKKFFIEIGSHNSKHILRYRKFQKYGEVA